jgi:hypothetical protein
VDRWDIYNNLGEIVAWGNGRRSQTGASAPPEHPFLPLRLLQRTARRTLARGTNEALR